MSDDKTGALNQTAEQLSLLQQHLENMAQMEKLLS